MVETVEAEDQVIDASENPATSSQNECASSKQPVAIVCGEAIEDLPDDLYIPPQALQIFLESFQGPLDLLLYLIRKQNIDILDIPVARITTQYIEYVQLMQYLNLELAGEYLVMAAILGEIKSRCLLPVQPKEDDPEADPRAELIRRLQAYEQIQRAAEDIDKLPRWERDFFPTSVALPSIDVDELLPDIKLNDILKAFQQVLKRAALFEHHSIQKEQLSTRERMSKVLHLIQEHQFLPFVSLFTIEEGRAGVVVTFLAILELVKESLLEIIQADMFGVIYISAKKQIDPSITITSSEFD